MKYLSFACLVAILWCATLAGSVSALPLASDQPSSELVVRCGIPSEFAVNAPLSRVRQNPDTTADVGAPVVQSQAASPAAVPEPSSLGLVGIGLGLGAAFRRFKRTRAQR